MLNKFIGMGRLTKHVEPRTTQSGKRVASFAVAVERDFKTQDGETQTDFLNCIAWGKTAEFIAKHFAKGDLICISGAVRTRTYEKDGQRRVATEINVDSAYFTGGKKASAPAAEDAPDDFLTDGSGETAQADFGDPYRIYEAGTDLPWEDG